MAGIETSIARVSDSNLIKTFVKDTLSRGTEFGFSESTNLTIVIQSTPFKVHFGVDGKDDETNCYLQDGKITHPFLTAILADNSTNNLVNRISLSDKKIHPYFSIKYIRSADSLIDRIESTDQALNTSALMISKHIISLLSINPIESYGQRDDINIASVHHDVLTRLEGVSLNLIEKQNEQIRKLDEDKRDFVENQLEEFARRSAELEADHKDKLNDLEEEYRERSRELDERQKKIEDADNTTTRRKTTTSMLDEVQQKAKSFNFSEGVANRSKLACVFAIILALIGGWNSYSSTTELYGFIKETKEIFNDLSQNKVSENTTNAVSVVTQYLDSFTLFLYIKIILSSALLVSSVVYLIRWFNSWADRLAQQELDNQMFVRDLNRAHLAVEMSLEWNEKKDGPIPQRLLESMTANLFQQADTKPRELLHPAEQLASVLVRSAEKIDVPFMGGNLEVSGKKLNKDKVGKGS